MGSNTADAYGQQQEDPELQKSYYLPGLAIVTEKWYSVKK
jgi:hypothetical protein